MHLTNKTPLTKADIVKIKKAVGKEYDVKKDDKTHVTISLIHTVEVPETVLGYHYHKLNALIADLNG